MKKLLLAFWLCGMGTALAQERAYLYDLPTLYPKAYATWQRMAGSPDWLHSLQGVASPIRDVTVNGQVMKFGTICKPHFCGDNIAGVLFSPQQDYIGGLVSLEGGPFKPIGTVSPTEATCIADFMGDWRTTRC